MPTWEGREVTIAEYRKLKKGGVKVINDKTSLVGKEVWWLSNNDTLDLYIGMVMKEEGEYLIVNAINQNKTKNLEELDMPEKVHKDDVRLNT